MKLLNKTYDSVTGFTEEFWFDQATSRVTIRRLQDVQGLVDDNQRMYNSHGHNPSYGDSKGGAHLVARVPFSTIERWMTEGFNWYQSTDKERRKKLNENKKFLVRPGKL